MDYDAQLLIGRTVTLQITKTDQRMVFRECVVKRFYADAGIWMCRDVYTRNKYYFDLADIIENKVNINV
jgi:hypothetical protein